MALILLFFLIRRYALCATDVSEWFWWYLQCDAISTILPQGLEYERTIKDHYLSCSQRDSKLKHVDMLCGASDLGWVAVEQSIRKPRQCTQQPHHLGRRLGQCGSSVQKT